MLSSLVAMRILLNMPVLRVAGDQVTVCLEAVQLLRNALWALWGGVDPVTV